MGEYAPFESERVSYEQIAQSPYWRNQLLYTWDQMVEDASKKVLNSDYGTLYDMVSDPGDDFLHNPDEIRKANKLVEDICHSRKYCDLLNVVNYENPTSEDYTKIKAFALFLAQSDSDITLPL